MPPGWHLTRWWYWCLLEDKTNGIEPIFTDKIGKCEKLVEAVNAFTAHRWCTI